MGQFCDNYTELSTNTLHLIFVWLPVIPVVTCNPCSDLQSLLLPVTPVITCIAEFMKQVFPRLARPHNPGATVPPLPES